MIIFDVDAPDSAITEVLQSLAAQVGERGRIMRSSLFDSSAQLVPFEIGSEVDYQKGRRRFAYKIDHRMEGIYVVVEFVHDGVDLDRIERALRLADPVVRHKLIRLPDDEAERRGMAPDDSAAAAAASS